MLRRSVFHVLFSVTMSAISAVLLSSAVRALGIAGSFRDYFLLFFTPIVLAIMLSPLWENLQRRAANYCFPQETNAYKAFTQHYHNLLSVLEHRATELEVLEWVGKAVNFSMEVDDLMELIYAQTSRVLATSNFYIALYNAEQETLSLAFCVEDDLRLRSTEEWPIDSVLSGHVVRDGRAIITDDYVSECLRRGIRPSGRGARAWMGVPLNATDQFIGVMNVSSFAPSLSYSEDDLRIFSAIADQAAAILDKARLYKQMEDRNRQLMILNDFGEAAMSSLDFRTVLDLIMEKAIQVMQVEAGSLLLVDERSGELTFEAVAGPGAEELVGTRLLPGVGIVGKVAETGDPVIIKRVDQGRRSNRVRDGEDFVARSVIVVPLVSLGRVIGVLELINRSDGRPFDLADQRFLMAFATSAALAVDNARLFTRTDLALSERVEELSMIQRFDRELNATLDYERVISLTLEWALRITGADLGVLVTAVEGDSGGDVLKIVAAHNCPEEFLEHYGSGQPWTVDHRIIGRALETHYPEVIEYSANELSDTNLAPGMVSQLWVPIQFENQVVVVLDLQAASSGTFDQEVIEFVYRLIDHATVAVANSRLFEKVHRANEAKSQFVSFVLHELKQPVTAIDGYTELLLAEAAGELREAQRDFLETILFSAQRVTMLLNDLTDISIIESGRVHLKLTSIRIAEVLDEVLSIVQGQITAKDQSLVLDIAPGLPCVMADRSRLTQILINLVSNANKYSREDGRITVRVQRWLSSPEMGSPGHYLVCSVIDNGVGISPDDLARLFTKYFRSDDQAVRSVSGTGLGLFITKSLIELQGGDIWVTSEVGKGSTFSFTLPIAGE